MSALKSFLETGDLKFLIVPRKKNGFFSRTLSGPPNNLTKEQGKMIVQATKAANDVIKTQIENNVWAYSYDLLNLTHIPSSALEISEKLGSLRKEIFNLQGPAGVFGVLATLLDFFTPFLKFTAFTIPKNITIHFFMIVSELFKNFFLPTNKGRCITFIIKGQSIIMVLLVVQVGLDAVNLTGQIIGNKDIYPPNKLTNGLDFSRNTVKIVSHATTESLPYFASNSNVPLFASALDVVDNLGKPVNNYVVQPALEHIAAASYGVANCINDIKLSTQTILFETGSSFIDFASSWNFLSNQTEEQKQKDFLEKSECLEFFYKGENISKIAKMKNEAPEIFENFFKLHPKICIKCIESLLDQSIALTDFDIYKNLTFPILSNSTEAVKGVINNLMQIKNIRNPPVPEDFSSSVNKLAIFNLLEIKSGPPMGRSSKVVDGSPPNLNVKDELLKLSNERLVGLQNTLAASNSMDELQIRLKVWVDEKIASKTYSMEDEISKLDPEGLAELTKTLKNLAPTEEITELTKWIDDQLIPLQKVNVTNDRTLYLSSDKTINFFVPMFDDSSSPYEANVNLEQQTDLTPVDGYDFSTRFDIFKADTMLVNTQFDPSAFIEDMFTNNSAGEAVTWIKDKVMINYFNKVGNARTKLSKKIQEEAVAELKDGIYNNFAQSLPNMWKSFTTGAALGSSTGHPIASIGLGLVASLYEPLKNYAYSSYDAKKVDPEAAANEFMNIVNTHGILSGAFDETTKASIQYFDNKLSGLGVINTKILHEWIYQLTLAGLEKLAGNVAEFQDEKGNTQYIVSEQNGFTWFLNTITRMLFSVSSDGFGGNNWWINVYNKPSVFWYAYSHFVAVFGGMAYFTSMVHQIFIFNSLMTYVLYWIHRTLYPTIFCNLSYSVQRGLKITLAKESMSVQNFKDIDLEAIIIVITAFERNSFSPKKNIRNTLKGILTNLEPLTAVRPENDQKWHAFTTYTLPDFNLKLLFDPLKGDNYRFHVGTSILTGSTVQSILTEKTKFELFRDIIKWNYTSTILFCDYKQKSGNFEQLILNDETLKTEGQNMFIFFGCPTTNDSIGCLTAPRTVKITSDPKTKKTTKFYRLVVVIDDKGTVYELLNQVWYKFKNTDDKGHIPEMHQAAGRHQENFLYLEKDRTYVFCVYKYMHVFNTNRKTRQAFFREKIDALIEKMDTENENGTQLQHIHDKTIRLQHSYEHPLCEFATFAIAVPGNAFATNIEFKKKIEEYKNDMIHDPEFIKKCETLRNTGLPTMTDLNKVSTEDPIWIIQRLAFKNNCNLKIYCVGRDTITYMVKPPTQVADLKTKAGIQPVVSATTRKLRSSKGVQAPNTISENEVLTNPEAKEPTPDIPTIHIGVIIKDLQMPYNHFFPSFEPSNNETIPGIDREDLNSFLKYYTDSVSPSYIQNVRTYLQEKSNGLFNLASRYLLNRKENNS